MRVQVRVPILLRAWQSPVRGGGGGGAGGTRARAPGARASAGRPASSCSGCCRCSLAVALAAAQLLAVGYSSVLAGNAAEAGALALAGGGDPRAGAREALPGLVAAHARVSVSGGEVRVELRPPALLRRSPASLEVSASARVEAP